MERDLPGTNAQVLERQWAAVSRLQDLDGTVDDMKINAERMFVLGLIQSLRERRRELRRYLGYLDATDYGPDIFPAASLFALLHGWDPRPSRVDERRRRFESELEEIEDDLEFIESVVGPD